MRIDDELAIESFGVDASPKTFLEARPTTNSDWLNLKNAKK